MGSSKLLSLTPLVARLNKNKIFKFFSSVRLAVPLMLVLAGVVSWGTILESQYNAEYSSLYIYKSDWFGLLLILLWLNIFLATLSRWPFKKHHTGFVITHIGLLILLIGGHVTNKYGIDGQLSIQENQSHRTVVLSKLMLGYIKEGQSTIQKVVFSKDLSPREKSSLGFLNEEFGHLVSAEKYLPFARVSKTYRSSSTDPSPSQQQEVALSFILKSQFFNVSEWLHTKENPQMQLGPATLKIVKSNAQPRKGLNLLKEQKAPQKSNSPALLHVLDMKTGNSISEIKLAELEKQPVIFKDLKIKLKKRYRSAVVSGNKLAENSDLTVVNPAVELEIAHKGDTLREVLYSQFQDFSLNKNGVFGYRFVFDNQSAETIPAVSSSPQEMPMGSRVIEFHVSPENKDFVQVVLFKEGKEVLRQNLKEGEKMTTPWMGMEIFLGSLLMNAAPMNEVININPEKRSDLPPSALMLKTNAEEFWLTEGDEKVVSINGQTYNFYFGKEVLELPFQLTLKNFQKKDYPGTNTAMSFESLVSVNEEPENLKISMNEPLKRDGYTIYQASYILTPGQPPVSVFSVNKDPGRVLKYLGSFILSLGIIIFTLMRSSFWKKLTSKGQA